MAKLVNLAPLPDMGIGAGAALLLVDMLGWHQWWVWITWTIVALLVIGDAQQWRAKRRHAASQDGDSTP